jgi:cytochrome c oxidase subunit 4
MATTNTTTTHRKHPTPKMYWALALVLAAITAVEVAIAYADVNKGVLFAVLIVAMLAKFGIVVGFYMHLRFDLKLYRNVFLLGLVGAFLLFTIVLLVSGVLEG